MLQIGKRYECESCGTQALVTKAGEGDLACCTGEMKILEPKKTKSAD